MSSRDACICVRFITPRHPPSSPSNHILLQSKNLIYKPNVRHSSTETPTEVPNDDARDAAVDLKRHRKSRSKKDIYFRTTAGLVLCRSPIITRDLSEFEKAFYAYQRHLKSRLSSPFPTDFYFQKGSLASKRWLAGEDGRRQANELVPTSSRTPEEGELTGAERELQDEEDVASSVAMSRTTDADRQNDFKSLNRKLDRTLYLLLKKPRTQHAWQFPQGPVGAGEVLHDSTSRILTSLAGPDMNTWTVGRVPIGHLTYQFQEPDMGFDGNKVFFLRARIFAGQCKLQKDSGIEDFGWFTREEVEKKVEPGLWKSISSMLASQ